MMQFDWDKKIERLQNLVMKPILFNDSVITLVDALEARHEKGWQVPEHRHPWFEFNFVCSGSIYTVIDGSGFETGQNSFFLVPPGVLHSNRNQTETQDDGICLRWQIEKTGFADQPHSSYQAVVQALTPVRACGTEAADIGIAIDNLLSKEETAGLQIAFLELIFMLVERWHDEKPAPVKERPHNEILVQQALLYLSEYYASHITIKDLAHSLNISYRHLVRIFHEITGETVIRRLNEIRVGHARQLLKTTEKTTREIAHLVGLENEFYFSNVFSKYTHMTPSQYRKGS
jgi:AraC-like DNA-binding protein/mannose-6-phosphate isomerase-like protein (cupin superfamily)